MKQNYLDGSQIYDLQQHYGNQSSSQSSRKKIQDFQNIYNLKKQRLYDALYFNQSELQNRRKLAEKQKQDEKDQVDQAQRKIYSMIQNERLQEIQKKNQIQQLLKKDYQEQINKHLQSRLREKESNIKYARETDQMLQRQEQRRLLDIEKMYHPAGRGKTPFSNDMKYSRLQSVDQPRSYHNHNNSLHNMPPVNNLAEKLKQNQSYAGLKYQQENKDSLKFNESGLNDIHKKPMEIQKNFEYQYPNIEKTEVKKQQISNFQEKEIKSIEQQSNIPISLKYNNITNSYNSRHTDRPRNQYQPIIQTKKPENKLKNDYKDYLQKQIQRKKIEKQHNKQQQLKRERKFINQEQKRYEDNQAWLKGQTLKQRESYKNSLDNQIWQKTKGMHRLLTHQEVK